MPQIQHCKCRYNGIDFDRGVHQYKSFPQKLILNLSPKCDISILAAQQGYFTIMMHRSVNLNFTFNFVSDFERILSFCTNKAWSLLRFS